MPKKEARKSRVDKTFLQNKKTNRFFTRTRAAYIRKGALGRNRTISKSRKKTWQKKQCAEEIAHKTAWAAVEKEYEKKGSKWVRKGEWLGSFHNQ